MALARTHHAMDGDKTMTLAIGFGSSSRATQHDILALIHSCLDPIPPNTLLATLDHRKLLAETVAEALNLRLTLFPAATLAQTAGTLTDSPIALANTGTANVAEAAALAALGPNAQLLTARRTGHLCTCAVAQLSEENS